MEGAALEAVLLAVANCFPDEALTSAAAPRRKDGTVKPLAEWSLADLVNVAKERAWLPTGLSPDENGDSAKWHIGDYADALRQLRNLVHPIRYAMDMPRKRITERYLESAFEIVDVVVQHLEKKLHDSLKEALYKEEESA